MKARPMSNALFLAVIVLAAGANLPARADDTEVFFFNPPAQDNDRPNVLFILDTGESMGEPLGAVGGAGKEEGGAPAYSAADSYDLDGTGCRADRLYFGFAATAGQPEPASCAGLRYVALATFACQAARPGLTSVGYATAARVISFDNTANPVRWRHLTETQAGQWIECGTDAGNHADGSAGYSCNGGADDNTCHPVDSASRWGKSAEQTIALAGAPAQTFFTANRVGYRKHVEKWLEDQGDDPAQARMTALRNAMKNVLDSVSGVNVALMRFSAKGADGKQTSGGMVLHHFEPVETAREKIKTILDSDRFEPLETCLGADAPCMGVQGRKSIGETLYEAYLYYAGEPVDFGTQSSLSQQVAFPSVPQSWGDGTAAPLANPVGHYRSPTAGQICNTDNYIVLLTDGFTEQDRSSDGDRIARLPKFSTTPYLNRNGSCDQLVYADGNPANGIEYVVNDDALDEDTGKMEGAPPGAEQGSFCVDDLAGYMWSVGVGPKASKVATYTIGFDLDRFDATGNYGKVARRSLTETAIRGGGEYYDARDQADLEANFTIIVRRILLENASFTSPSVAVNSFNRTQNLDALYLAMFKPDFNYRWKGNLKRYKLVSTEDAADCKEGAVCDPNDIRDKNNRDAVEIDNGAVLRFSANAWSYWSDTADGFDAAAGGAAGEIKVPADRKIYSNLSADSGPLNEELSTLEVSAAGPELALANQLLLGVDSADPVDHRPSPETLVKWAYGFDVRDQVGEPGTTGDARLDMGDPLHGKPAVVSYGGAPEDPDVTVYLTTNDGFLHAIDADDGRDLWAFIPRQLLGRLEKLYLNEEVAVREYGLDSPMRMLRYDENDDGRIIAADGDRVVLYFGMRRGGGHYFAVDVTNRAAPKLLWRIGAIDDAIAAGSARHLPGIGQTWSVPQLARINVGGHDYAGNPLKWVLVFGGGYNPNHDRIGYRKDGGGNRVFDTLGNRVYVVDAITGEKLWRAGPDDDGGAQLKLSAMNNALPADVRVFDLSGDGFADRIYASDLGGQVWRFDIFNGAEPNSLVTGGRFAALGDGHLAAPGDGTDSRRFFYAPDPSLITYNGETWINIAIGSGHREKPASDATTQNRAFGLRDYRPFQQLTQQQHDAWEADKLITDDADDPYCDADFVDAPPADALDQLLNVTGCTFAPIPKGSRGWKLDLKASSGFARGGAFSGEKVLAETVTFQNVVYVPSYEPGSAGDACASPTGINRLYAVAAVNGADDRVWLGEVPVGEADPGDRVVDVKQGGIAPPVMFIFPPGEAGLRNGAPKCLAGLAECGQGIETRPVRTYWRQRGTQ
jgi:type IV pilus assembly protein PilY1